ncbi:MAG: hypothetical protein A2Z02_01605 [Chloroflexi bacterium RBG_16_48_7]|nr:MAG: hypothetical protein A2Z02_01605 [Chloroflexi bacterium RBG_16_48_7]
MVPPQFKGDSETIVAGADDGHQFEEISHKVREDAQERLKKTQGRYQEPKQLTIITRKGKDSGQVRGYIVEVKNPESKRRKYF